MTELHPIVYTRPFDKDDDFRFFARPISLVGDAYFVERMRNVLATESYRGGIKGKRWHVLRTKNAVVVGFATQEFERYDDVHGRRLRGYYGFEMPLVDVCLPDIKLFCALDSIIVEPLFHVKNLAERDFGNIKEAPFDQPEMYHPITEYASGRKFNTDRHVVNYIPIDVVVEELLKEALNFAVKNENFECVIGLNSRKHAEESQVQNCLCYEQPTALRVSVRKAESSDVVKDAKRPTSNKEHRSSRPIPPNPSRPHAEESELGWGGLLRSIFSFGTNDSRTKPYPAQGKKSPQVPTTSRESIKNQPSAPSSVVASHRRGWNVAKPKQESPVDIPNQDETHVKCSMAKDSETKLSDIVEKLAALHAQWYQLSIGNQVQLDMCNNLADILRQCHAIPIMNEDVFDPDRHVDINDSNPDKGAQIIATLAPGWMYGGKVLEKASVKCGNMSSQDSSSFVGQINQDELMQEA